eukprot:6185454-Pleurochrysis_carterae.AAC.1
MAQPRRTRRGGQAARPGSSVARRRERAHCCANLGAAQLESFTRLLVHAARSFGLVLELPTWRATLLHSRCGLTR